MSSADPGAFEVAGRDPATGRHLTVRVEDGRIADIRTGDHHTGDSRTGTTDDAWLAPGLVDVQVNGFAGHDVNAADAGPETVLGMLRALHDVGVTTAVPTVITASREHIVAALRTIAATRDRHPLARHAIPFVHVEGPHLSTEDGARGVHPAEHIRPPDAEEFAGWQQACDGLVGMVTLSPHYDESPAYIATLASRGVRVAIGHTHATPQQITAAADAGATVSTHLGNGAHAVLPRHPHYIWAQLAEDRLAAGFIADGHHLPPDTLVAMIRAKGLERSFLVSDAVALAGSAPGVYRTPVGGEVELSADGRLSHRGTPYLAGAARPVSDGVAHLANLGRFSLGQAVRLATWSPGRLCGGRGDLRVGAPADLVRFRWSPGDPTLAVEQTVVGGHLRKPFDPGSW